MNKSRISLIIVSLGVLFYTYAMAEGPDVRKTADDGQGKVQAAEDQQLSNEQSDKIKSILSAYDPATITASDAKAIHNAFREAGIRKGPGMLEAVKAVGFDHEKLRSLDPPPDANEKKDPSDHERKPHKGHNDKNDKKE